MNSSYAIEARVTSVIIAGRKTEGISTVYILLGRKTIQGNMVVC